MIPHGMDKEKLWVAYLDGQLSASETVSFEGTLNEAERDHAAQEVLLERALGDSLQEAPACPDALWQAVAAELSASAVSRAAMLTRFRVSVATLASLAAVAIFTFSGVFGQERTVEPILALATDLPQFENQSSTPGEREAVQEFMLQRQVELILNDLSTSELSSHPIRLLGASEQGCHGNSVMEIRFECCGKPVKVVLARLGTKASSIVREGTRKGDVQHVRQVGDYLIGVVSKHHTPDLTALFEAPRPRLAGVA